MEQVTVWYQTDNQQGLDLARSIASIGVATTIIDNDDFSEANIVEGEINAFIFDMENKTADQILEIIDNDRRMHPSLKFIIVKKKELPLVQKKSLNYMHLEFLSRPLDKREFLLLIEKSIIVERYREMMKYISKEAESRIESFEELMDINRKNAFVTGTERNAFENILKFEKNLMNEQLKLAKAIRSFTLLRQNEIFDMKQRIKAEEMLGSLREKELKDAKSIINAQENVLDHSAKELDEAKKIINATEQVAELSRSEAIELHEQLEKEKHLNHSLSDEIDRLLSELDELKQQNK